MKNKLKMLGLAIVTGITLFAAVPKAAADPQSFGGTNNISSGVSFTTYPTNGPGLATGNDIDLRSYKVSGFYLSGYVVNSNASTIAVQLARCYNAANSSSITNWETTPQASAKIFISVPAMTNTFTFITNLVEDVDCPADSIGVSQLTNSFTATCFMTNADFGVIKKIIPIRYP